jgi:hypothetical protein
MPERRRFITNRSRELEIGYVDIEPRVIAQLEPVIDSMVWMLPPWCSRLAVFVDDTDGFIATMGCDVKYRRARLTLDPKFLIQSAADQREYLAHEFTHVLIAPMQDMGKDLIDTIHGGDPLVQALRRRWSEAYESVCEDVMRAVSGRGSRVRAKR